MYDAFRGVLFLTLACLALLVPLSAADAQKPVRQFLWQTNASGTDIDIYDVATGDKVDRLTVGPNPYGIAAAGKTVFVSLENRGGSFGELLWIDRKSRQIRHRLKVGPQPHDIAVTPNGKWIYVACRDGHYWIIDAKQKAVVARIETGGRPHNTAAHPDGSRVYLSPTGSPKRVTIVDPTQGHKIVGFMAFSAPLRPPALAPGRNLFFHHVDGFNGFEVADLETNALLERVEHKRGLGIPVWPRMLGFLDISGFNRCQGLAVHPDEKEIWSVCGAYATIHGIALTDTPGQAEFKELGHLKLPSRGYWLSHSPDGKYAFIALAETGQVAQVDTSSRRIIRLLKAGDKPKRNIVVRGD